MNGDVLVNLQTILSAVATIGIVWAIGKCGKWIPALEKKSWFSLLAVVIGWIAQSVGSGHPAGPGETAAVAAGAMGVHAFAKSVGEMAAGGKRIRPDLMLALTLGALLMAAPSRAQSPPMLSLERAQAGVTLAEGATIVTPEGRARFALFPDVYLSYSATSQLAVATSMEYDTGAHATSARLGGRLILTAPGDANVLALAVDGILYQPRSYREHPTSWGASLRFGRVLLATDTWLDRLYVVGSLERDVPNHVWAYRAGLRLPLLGGVQ